MKSVWITVCLTWAVAALSASASAAPSGVERDFLELINAHRADSATCWNGQKMTPWPTGSVRALAWSPALSRAAQGHNLAMIEWACTDHTCPGEASLPQRVADAGYPDRWAYLSENIAGGFEQASEVFAVWHESGGHNRNMLACRSRAIGISRVYEPASPAWWYWTTDFGDVVDAAAPPASSAGESLAQALDANGNGVIGDREILKATAYWVRGEPVPDARRTIGDRDMLNLLALWIRGSSIPSP